jgi:hypothetical protein
MAPAHRVSNTDTAFSYRDANWAEAIVGMNPEPENWGKSTNWCKDYFDALHPYSAGGAYRYLFEKLPCSLSYFIPTVPDGQRNIFNREQSD